MHNYLPLLGAAGFLRLQVLAQPAAMMASGVLVHMSAAQLLAVSVIGSVIGGYKEKIHR